MILYIMIEKTIKKTILYRFVSTGHDLKVFIYLNIHLD